VVIRRVSLKEKDRFKFLQTLLLHLCEHLI